ncbi:MAG: hypothetical protein ACFCVA_10735 [Gammaproteobacteria bacterium]
MNIGGDRYYECFRSAIQEGKSVGEVARMFNVHGTTIYRLLQAPQESKLR